MYRSRMNNLIKLLREYEHDATARGDGDGVQAAIEMRQKVARRHAEICLSVAPQHNPVLAPPVAQALHERLSA